MVLYLECGDAGESLETLPVETSEHWQHKAKRIFTNTLTRYAFVDVLNQHHNYNSESACE